MDWLAGQASDVGLANLRIAYSNNTDGASLSSNSQVTGLGVANLLTMQPSERWRSTNVNDPFVVADLGSAKSVGIIALLFHNASSAATWQVRAATSVAALTSSPGYDSGTLNMWANAALTNIDWTHSLHFPAATQTFQFWRLDIADPTNADSFIDASRLYLETYWQPTINKQWGWGLAHEDSTPLLESVGAQVFPLRRPPRKVYRFDLSFLDKDEMYANALEIDRLRGRARDILCVPDADDSTNLQLETTYGLIADTTEIVNPAFDIFTKALRVRELLP